MNVKKLRKYAASGPNTRRFHPDCRRDVSRARPLDYALSRAGSLKKWYLPMHPQEVFSLDFPLCSALIDKRVFYRCDDKRIARGHFSVNSTTAKYVLVKTVTQAGLQPSTSSGSKLLPAECERR